MVATSSRAWASVASGFRRPTVPRYQAPRLLERNRASYSSGVQRSVPAGKAKPAGAMPTIVNGSRLSWTVWPTTPGSPPKRSRQRAWPRTASLVCPGSFSPFSNARPNAGLTRSTSKKEALTSVPSTLAGWPRPVRVTPLVS